MTRVCTSVRVFETVVGAVRGAETAVGGAGTESAGPGSAETAKAVDCPSAEAPWRGRQGPATGTCSGSSRPVDVHPRGAEGMKPNIMTV